MHKKHYSLVLFLLKISDQEIHKNNLTNDNLLFVLFQINHRYNIPNIRKNK